MLLRPEGKAKLLALAGDEPRPPPRPMKAILCPECGAGLPRKALRDLAFAPCPTCGVAWVGPGALPAWAAGGPARGAPAGGRARARDWRGGAALLAGLGLAAAAALLITRAREASPPPDDARPAGSAAAAAAAPSALEAPPAPKPRPAPSRRGPFEPPLVLGSLEGFQAPVEAVDLGPGAPRLLLAPREGPDASILVRFDSGSFDDAQAGEAQLTLHALLAANPRFDLGRFLLDVHAAGARLEHRTGVRESTFQLTAGRREFPALARRLAEAALAATFEPLRLPDATTRALLDLPTTPTPGELVAELAAEEPGYANPPVVARPDLLALRQARVRARLLAGFSPASATVVVTGAFDRAAAIALVRPHRGGARPPVAPLRTPVPFEARRASDRHVVLFAAPVELSSPRDAAALRLAAALLDAGLWERFRLSGAGYAPGAEAFRAPWTALLVAVLPAHAYARRLEPELRALVDELRGGRYEVRDLDRAKGAVRGELLAVDADPAALAAALAAGGPSWHGAEVAREVDALDRAGLTAILSGWLDPARSVYLFAGANP
ncbi:MAG: hypothetical protein QM704_09755 [Anaeromyxobacteraceae bacterium]